MMTVLLVLGTLLALISMPAATILAFIGLWIAGTTGAVIGAIIGLMVQAGY